MCKPLHSLAFSLLATCSAFSSNALALNFSKLWVDYGNDKKVAKNYAANPSGDILFREIDTTMPAGSGWQLRVGGSAPITVIGSDFASTVQGPVSLSNARDVAFQSFDPSAPSRHGVFERTGGGQVVTLSGAPFGKAEGAPSMSPNGDVVFLSMDATGAPTVNVRSAGGFVGTIPSAGFVSRFGRPAVNTALNVVSSGQFADGEEGLAIGRVGGGTPLTITGDWRRLATSQPQIASNGAVLFSVELDPQSGQATGQRQLTLAMPSTAGNGYQVSTVANLDDDSNPYFNDSLAVAAVNRTRFMMFLPTGTPVRGTSLNWNPITLLTLGDAFDGSTVTSITLGDGSVQPDNSVIFHATLANGGGGIYQVMVPEPTSIAALGASLLLTRRRR